MRALVLHHAPTNKTFGQIVGCRVDRPLSQFGRETSQRLAEWLRQRREAGEFSSIRRVVTSPLRRATETASRVASVCGLEVLTDARLRAQDFGDLDGLTFDQIEADPLLRKFLWKEIEHAAREKTRPPGGESNWEFGRRALEAVRELADEESIFIAHGTVIDALIARCLGREMHDVEGIARAFEGDLLEFVDDAFMVREHTFAPFGHIDGIRDVDGQQRLRLISNYIHACEREDERIHLHKLLDHMGRNEARELNG